MGFLTSYRVESPINQLYCQLLLNPVGKEATSSFQKLKKTNVRKEGEDHISLDSHNNLDGQYLDVMFIGFVD